MKFLEKDLEDIIYEELNKSGGLDKLECRGLSLEGIQPDYIKYTTFKQLSIGNYGISDLIIAQRGGGVVNINILELKKDEINIDALSQVSRYIEGVKMYMESRGVCCNVRGTLIGSCINLNSDFLNICKLIDSVDLYVYKYTIDGLSFNYKNSLDYSLITSGFFKI